MLGSLALLVAGEALAAGAKRGTAGALYIGCRQVDGGGYNVTGVDLEGATRFDLPLPDRGHAIACHPVRNEAVVFARRPGRFMVVFDPVAGEIRQRLDAAEGRHFYGHGVFTADGRYLLTTENAYETGAGRIAVRDAEDGYRQIDEVASHGIGPHDLCLLDGDQRLLVANGGIRTHPDHDRKKLNIESMRPNLSVLDLVSGACLAQAALPSELHKLSIRHLAVAPRGLVGLALQYEGSKRDAVPLIATFDGSSIRPFQHSAGLARSLRHYTGSIAFDASGAWLAVTSPRAHTVTIWHAESGELVDRVSLADGCGAAATPGKAGFLLAGDRLSLYRNGSLSDLPYASPTAWDNHLLRT